MKKGNTGGGVRTRAPGIGAVVAGVAAVAAAMFVWTGGEETVGYSYVVSESLESDENDGLASIRERGVVVRRAEVVSGTGERLAELRFAETDGGPILADWRPRVDPPFITSAPALGEVADLAPVLERHLPDDGYRLLAWWDTSRRLRLLGDVEAVFDEHIGEPLFVPAKWSASYSRIAEIETRFWGAPPDDASRARFMRFADSLLKSEDDGIRELTGLAGDGAAVLVLHVRDVVLLGQLAPERIGVAFRDFPADGDVHGMVRSARAWVSENGYHAYATMQPDPDRVRVVALTDEASGNTLAARLLPFIGNDQSSVSGTRLVYKTGGFWVYEIEGAKAIAGASSS
ncbi:MAG: hydroxylamine oxidation protein HaoB [Proteobacteria bacterium]|nr:MAG: hydroxylamine oxidation protein HaoB [Pseudomonadota bacterium]